MTAPVPFSVALSVEAVKLRRSLALLLAVAAPMLVVVFVFFFMLRGKEPVPWSMALQMSAAIWAFFMLPMSVTALTALVAQADHGPRAWDTLRAMPVPRWHLYAAKAVVALGLVAVMSAVLAVATVAAVTLAAWIKPAIAPNDVPDFIGYAALLGRIFLAAWLLVAVQSWVALRYASFVPALATGIAGTFFAVVATSAKIGMVLPWQIPINQLAPDQDRALLALMVGCIGGCLALLAMLWHLSRREVV
jgi:hypothetical protein